MQKDKDILQFLKSLEPDTRHQGSNTPLPEDEAKSSQSLQKLWELTGQYNGAPKVDENDAWQRFKDKTGKITPSETGRIRQMPARRTTPRWINYAAAAALLALVWWGWQKMESNGSWTEVATLANEKKSIQLPDGSTVVLNRNSTLRFQNNKAWTNKRLVELDGEAFFDVATDSLHHFTIIAAEAEVEVLGTSFNVRNYANEAEVEVSVATGTVALRDKKRPADQTIIKAGHKSRLTRRQELVENSLADANDHAWRTGQLKFASKKVETAIKDIERYYDVQLDISQSQINGCSLTLNFEKEPISRVLGILKKVYGVEVRSTGANRYALIGGKCS